jgi:hypothetical protein
MPLESPEVIVHLLPRQSDHRRQGCGRSRLSQLGQQSGPHRIQGHTGDGRVFDHRDVKHAATIAPTTFPVNTLGIVGTG